MPYTTTKSFLKLCTILLVSLPVLAADMAVAQPLRPELNIVPSHEWLPPFGLDCVGRPLVVKVSFPTPRDVDTAYWLAGYLNGKEVQRHDLAADAKRDTLENVNVQFSVWPEEVVLFAKSATDEKEHRVAERKVEAPALEVAAHAWPVQEIHPLDLGTIFVPQNWTLVPAGQAAYVEIAALSRSGELIDAVVSAWYDSVPQEKTTARLPMTRDAVQRIKLLLEHSSTTLERDTLHIGITDGMGKEVWRKDVPVMLATQHPRWPRFGATVTKLRYDERISVRQVDGSFSKLDYADAWDARLNDVVVSLPNGSRFVFWRGSSYIPFWAGRHNTGLSYEWAEIHRKDAVDCVEPLMDKELRYGRVNIVESTAARVHVRWNYESCDFNYKVWGDSAVEDFYFYPDGFGSRVLTIQSAPESEYELSEFIILTPQDAMPLQVLPANLVDILFLDGEKREIDYPYDPIKQGDKMKSRDQAAVFRARLHRDDQATAVYFCPGDLKLPPVVFQPFLDAGHVVTPCYWGSHWPLARGQATGGKIDERIHSSPSHNSVMSWATQRPSPLRDARLITLDSLGRARPMQSQTWAWLIGMTDASDDRLLEWAHSFSTPPSITGLKGARLATNPYVPERRAICLKPETTRIELTLTPGRVCVNPVLEIVEWSGRSVEVWLDDRKLAAKDYAWDGRVLWIEATFSIATRLRIEIAQ